MQGCCGPPMSAFINGEVTGAGEKSLRAACADTADHLAGQLALPFGLMLLSGLWMTFLMRKKR